MFPETKRVEFLLHITYILIGGKMQEIVVCTTPIPMMIKYNTNLVISEEDITDDLYSFLGNNVPIGTLGFSMT